MTETNRGRLERIIRESRLPDSELAPVTPDCEKRALELFGKVPDPSFVTATGDGAIQFEWERGELEAEVVMEPDYGFSIYVFRQRDGQLECLEERDDLMIEELLGTLQEWRIDTSLPEIFYGIE